MKLPLRSELQELLRRDNGLCVSLFMPIFRTSGQDRRSAATYLANMLDKAADQLQKRGMRRPDAEALLKPARNLTEDTMYWQNGLSDGLAVFLGKGVFREYKVPLALAENLYVDDRFHIAPLLPIYSGDARFYILCISQNAVRLFEGNRHDIHELEPKGLPKSLVDALDRIAPTEAVPRQLHDDRNDQLGHGAGLEHVNHRLTRYFREIDTNLLNLIGGDQAPLVLAGVSRDVGLYRQVSSYKKILDEFISGNPELLSPKQLHASAVNIVKPVFQNEEAQARREIEKLGGTERVTTDPGQIVTAAQNGRIDTLFVRQGHQCWGTFDPGNNETHVHVKPENGDKELVSVAAEQTFLNGGAVFFCPDENHIPRHTPMAALLRY